MDPFTLDRIEFDAVRRILSGFCATGSGKALATRIGPSRNPDTVRRWLCQTSQMVRAIRDCGLVPMGGVTDISGPLSLAHAGGGAGGEDFAAIASALEGAGCVLKYLNGLDETLDLLAEFARHVGRFDDELEAIRAIVGPDASIRDDASPRLSELRRRITATTQEIHDVIHGYLRQPEVAKLLQSATVTLHGDRYVLPVKVENRGRLPGVVHRASDSGATVFVEPNASVELNNRLADLCNDRRREEQRLLNQLALRVGARSREITDTMRTLAQLDVLSAKAQYAYQFDMTCPEITEHGPLRFDRARHPLLVHQESHSAGLPASAEQVRQAPSGSGKSEAPEERPQQIVPIDVRLGSDFDLLVITGSNTGGKTVTLKTVALLVVMAHSGMHVPVRRGATMPVIRDVLIDIGDEQSLQQSLSTFGAHIKRIRYILRKADRSCLVLLDELGAGTDPDEGGAIGQAILDQLRRLGCLGMVTTHLSVLKAYAFNHERVDNASVEFDTETLKPTYHLRIGTPGESHAIAVAKRLGLPRPVVSSARRHLDTQGRQFRRAIRATGAARQMAEQARAEAQTAQVEALGRQELFQAKLADLHRLQGQFETWLATLSQLKGGDEVFVPSLKKKCCLVRLELHKQIALVESDGLQVEVPLGELMPDLGQEGVRREIAELRKQILDQARAANEEAQEARRIRQEYHRSLQQQQLLARQFDRWLGAIARVKVGDRVTIARPPGAGRLEKVDFAGLRAVVSTDKGPVEVSLQELFPQTGPFAARPPRMRRPKGRGARAGEQKGESTGRPKEHRKDKLMTRRSPEDYRARSNREAVLAAKPGEQVFVVPFHKRATLIRFHKDKDLAVVQSGVFEMEIPLADLEPLGK